MLTSADRELASGALSIIDTEEGLAGNDRATKVLTSSQLLSAICYSRNFRGNCSDSR